MNQKKIRAFMVIELYNKNALTDIVSAFSLMRVMVPTDPASLRSDVGITYDALTFLPSPPGG